MDKLLKKLQAVQTELKAPKGQYNSFGKYSYRSCEDILEAVKPLLSANGLVLTLRDGLEVVGEWHYVKATATVYDADTGSSLETAAYAREEQTKKGMDGSQITGTASSYARKYALNAMFLIDDTKDADATNQHGKGAAKPAPKPKQAPSKRDQMLARIKQLEDSCVANGVKPEASVMYMEACFGTGNKAELTDEQLIELGKHLAQVANDSKQLNGGN